MKAVIMAGGRGTRIASVNSEVPKPMIPVLNKPVLEYQIEALREQNFTEIVLVIGYLGEVIENYFQDGKKFGVNIEYLREETPLGTAGALYYLRGKIEEDFLLLCGDLLFDVDFSRFYAAHKRGGGLATIFTHPNSHPFDSALIVTDEEGKVVDWLHKEDPRGWYKNRVNAGLHFFSPKILDRFPSPEKRDLDREILKPLISEGMLYSYDSPEYVKDMGTPDRLYSLERDLLSGKIKAKNLKNPQRAIFLDRDGTINRYVGFLKSAEEFSLLPKAAEAIKLINDSPFLAIVVSNQPVIARGETSLFELEEIHRKMETLLGEEGAYLDAVYFCPHHPDRGFEGERVEYKIDCDCRKPKTGMLKRAAEKFHIDLEKSYLIGDSPIDILCGKNAGCKTAGIGLSEGDFTGESLFECVNKILESEHAA